jgi:predicted MFS family arabinose efflux permease
MLTAAACIGLAYGSVVPTMQLVALEQPSPERVNVVMAIYFAFPDLGMAAGSYLVGVCIPLLGYATLYMLLWPFVLSVALFHYMASGQKEVALPPAGLPLQGLTERL